MFDECISLCITWIRGACCTFAMCILVQHVHLLWLLQHWLMNIWPQKRIQILQMLKIWNKNRKCWKYSVGLSVSEENEIVLIFQVKQSGLSAFYSKAFNLYWDQAQMFIHGRRVSTSTFTLSTRTSSWGYVCSPVHLLITGHFHPLSVCINFCLDYLWVLVLSVSTLCSLYIVRIDSPSAIVQIDSHSKKDSEKHPLVTVYKGLKICRFYHVSHNVCTSLMNNYYPYPP